MFSIKITMSAIYLNSTIENMKVNKGLHLLWFGLLCSQADYHHHNQSDEGQQRGEVQVMDVFQQPGPVILLRAQGRRINEVQRHAGAAHQQADSQAPESPLKKWQQRFLILPHNYEYYF